MKPLAETLAPACTSLHAQALRRVARGASMFDYPTRDPLTLRERAAVSQDLRRWCLVTGKGDEIQLTRAGHAVVNKLEGV